MEVKKNISHKKETECTCVSSSIGSISFRLHVAKYLETRGEQLLREIIKTNDFSKLYTSLTDAHKADLDVPSIPHNILGLWSQGLTQNLASTLAV